MSAAAGREVEADDVDRDRVRKLAVVFAAFQVPRVQLAPIEQAAAVHVALVVELHLDVCPGSVGQGRARVESAGLARERVPGERPVLNLEGLDRLSPRGREDRVEEAGKLRLASPLAHDLSEQEVVERVEPSRRLVVVFCFHALYMGESRETLCSLGPFFGKNAAGPRSCRRRASREGAFLPRPRETRARLKPPRASSPRRQKKAPSLEGAPSRVFSQARARSLTRLEAERHPNRDTPANRRVVPVVRAAEMEPNAEGRPAQVRPRTRPPKSDPRARKLSRSPLTARIPQTKRKKAPAQTGARRAQGVAPVSRKTRS